MGKTKNIYYHPIAFRTESIKLLHFNDCLKCLQFTKK